MVRGTWERFNVTASGSWYITNCPTIVRKIVLGIYPVSEFDVFIASVHSRSSFVLGLSRLQWFDWFQFLIAQLMSQVLDISSYREAGETRQVPVERQVLPLEHNQVWTRTTVGLFRYKRCKSKNSLFCAMLATFCHCGHFMHVVWQPFRAMPLAQDMFCTLDAVLCWHLSTHSNQIIQILFSFVKY